jgi:hypothetical protein
VVVSAAPAGVWAVHEGALRWVGWLAMGGSDVDMGKVCVTHLAAAAILMRDAQHASSPCQHPIPLQ